MCVVFFFQAEDGIRDLVRSRGLGDVYKRQVLQRVAGDNAADQGVVEYAIVVAAARESTLARRIRA